MQAQLFGNLAQHHRTHGQFTVDEEILLSLRNRIADSQNRVEALLDVFNKPTRFLQALL
jgi:hypothetical protein